MIGECVKKSILAIIMLLLISSCTNQAISNQTEEINSPKTTLTETPISASAPTPSPTPIADLAPLFADNTLKQIEVMIQDSEFATAGALLSVKLRNDSEETRDFYLTCGYTFSPSVHENTQKLILIQPLEFSMPPLEWLILNPVTVSLDPQKDIPLKGEFFEFGPMAEGNLKKLADCSCKKEIAADDDTTLFTQQVAYWMVALGKDSRYVSDLSNEEFINLLLGFGVDQPTIDSLRDYVLLFKLNVAVTLTTCGL
jgi:hypothetical protein